MDEMASRCPSRPGFLLGCIAAATVCFFAALPEARGQEQLEPPIPVERVEARFVRVDGSLREWEDAGFQTVRSTGRSFGFAFRAAPRGLYFAASVEDARVVRRVRLEAPQDALVLRLSVPPETLEPELDWTAQQAPWPEVRITLFPGVPGKPAAVAVSQVSGTGAIEEVEAHDGLVVLEGPRNSRVGPASRQPGFELEAFIPYSLFAQEGRWISARAAVEFHDVDRETRPRVRVARSSAADASQLPRLAPYQGLGEALQAVLVERGLDDVPPTLERWVQVAGTDAPEWLQVRGSTVVVLGPAYRGGNGLSLRQLTSLESEPALALHDPDGDGRFTLALGRREEVDSVSVVEREIRFSGNRIHEVAVAPAPSQEQAAAARQTSTQQTPTQQTSTQQTPTRGTRQDVPSQAGGSETRGGRHATVPVPAVVPPGIEDARLRLVGNVAEGPAPEQVALVGQKIYVYGGGFRGGQRWFFFEVPVAGEEDILDLRLEDLTGDGRRELLVFTREHFVSEDSGEAAPVNDAVSREVLSVFQFRPRCFHPLRRLEVAWNVGDRRVERQVRFLRHRRRGKVLRLTGPSRGEQVFWPRTPPGGDTDPLTPLGRGEAVRYRYDAENLVPERRTGG